MSLEQTIEALPATLHAEGSPNIVAAFIGENENGILRQTSQEFMDLLAPYGLSGHVINIYSEGWREQLQSLLEQGMLFAWGAAGIGASLKANDAFFWDMISVPFISVLADTPCQLPANHHIPARYVANGYQFQDWLKMQRRLVRSPQISAMLPVGIVANQARDAVSWSDRPYRMIFVKTCMAPELHRARWVGLPKRFIAVIEDSAASILQQGIVDITDTVLQSVDHHGLFLEHRPEVLFGLMAYVDFYVRDYRSTLMAQALLDLPVDIIGRGWEHVSTPGCRARFHKAVDAKELLPLYANTQFVLNTMPNFSTGTHERVLNAFAAKSCVVTNENDDMRRRFGPLPSYFGLNTADPDLKDQLAAIYHGTERFDDHMQPALDLVQTEHNAEKFVCAMFDVATEVKAAANDPFNGFRY